MSIRMTQQQRTTNSDGDEMDYTRHFAEKWNGSENNLNLLLLQSIYK